MKRPMTVRVYYDHEGQIVSIVEVKTEPNVPPAGIAPIPNTDSCDVELTDELAELPMLDLHTNYRIDFKARRPMLRQSKTAPLQE